MGGSVASADVGKRTSRLRTATQQSALVLLWGGRPVEARIRFDCRIRDPRVVGHDTSGLGGDRGWRRGSIRRDWHDNFILRRLRGWGRGMNTPPSFQKRCGCWHGMHSLEGHWTRARQQFGRDSPSSTRQKRGSSEGVVGTVKNRNASPGGAYWSGIAPGSVLSSRMKWGEHLGAVWGHCVLI